MERLIINPMFNLRTVIESVSSYSGNATASPHSLKKKQQTPLSCLDPWIKSRTKCTLCTLKAIDDDTAYLVLFKLKEAKLFPFH